MNRLVSILLCVVVISINIFFVTNQVQEANLAVGWIILVGNYDQVSAYSKF